MSMVLDRRAQRGLYDCIRGITYIIYHKHSYGYRITLLLLYLVLAPPTAPENRTRTHARIQYRVLITVPVDSIFFPHSLGYIIMKMGLSHHRVYRLCVVIIHRVRHYKMTLFYFITHTICTETVMILIIFYSYVRLLTGHGIEINYIVHPLRGQDHLVE